MKYLLSCSIRTTAMLPWQELIILSILTYPASLALLPQKIFSQVEFLAEIITLATGMLY
ncbi:hypothetical protein B6N60_03169 [Richelia sinica FACHB-800]|uniref:Uncharacterized protein n=1 Tax=Richelia sinica FACHB-800 TaxID=1357546 RepID=A0A975Y5Q6_9NOST|nr:hypothetical protein B6N60_03169 [Richelia sinica FACHB-800]